MASGFGSEDMRGSKGMFAIFSHSGLVSGLEFWNFLTFHSVGNFIIPTDEVHHLSEG